MRDLSTDPSFSTCLHRLFVSHHKDVQHVDVGVLAEDVGLGVMLEVSVVPPVCRGALRKHS